MKLKLEQLASHLSSPLQPIYLVSGDEPLLVQEACDQIRAAAKKQGFEERSIFEVEGQYDWSEFLESANALSLFADKKLLDVRIPKGKPGDKGSKAIIQYLQSPSPDNIVLITTPKLEASVSKAKWVSQIESVGAWIQIWPLEPYQMEQWIIERGKVLELQINKEAAMLLAERAAGNLLAASQELEKLKLAGYSQLDAHLVNEHTSHQARFEIFQLGDACLQGNLALAGKIFSFLQQDGTEPTLILWSLTKEVRALIELQQSGNLQQSFKKLRIWPKRQGLYRQALSRFSPAQLFDLLQRCKDLDQSLKQGDGFFKHDLQALCYGLTGLTELASV